MSLRNFLTYIGKNNKPYYPTVAVACAELVCRPLFTMMDKKSPSETKKYTALREGLTELIAAPTYLVLPILAAKGSDLLKLKDPKSIKMAKHNLQTLGTWTAALVVIPGLCSALVKPFTDKIYNKKNKNKENNVAKLDVVSPTEKIANPAQITQTGHYHPMQKVTFASFTNSNMRVG
jgi:hypothetical protein